MDYICPYGLPAALLPFNSPTGKTEYRVSISDYIQLFRSHRPMRYGKRLIIAEELYGADGYADGDMLWQSLRVRGIRVSQATVYDALNWLVSEGIAVKKAGVNKRNLYMIGQDFRQFVQSGAAFSSR